MTLQEGLNILRLDAGVNDALIQALIYSATEYIRVTTGMSAEKQTAEPMCETATGFLLKLWYFGDKADVDALKRIINSLIQSIKAKVETTD